MNDAARDALADLIYQYGGGIHQVPRSCELLIQQACRSYPRESQLLIEALRDGIPNDLNQYRPVEESWDAVVDALTHRLRHRGLAEDEGRWAVETWARVLFRHPENYAETPPLALPETTRSEPEAAPDPAERLLRLIVSAGGGALGGFVGAALYPLSILVTEVPMRVPYVLTIKRAFAMRETHVAAVFVALLFALGGACCGAFGSTVAWKFARGERRLLVSFVASGVGAFLLSLVGVFSLGILGGSVGAFLGAIGVVLVWGRRGQPQSG